MLLSGPGDNESASKIFNQLRKLHYFPSNASYECQIWAAPAATFTMLIITSCRNLFSSTLTRYKNSGPKIYRLTAKPTCSGPLRREFAFAADLEPCSMKATSQRHLIMLQLSSRNWPPEKRTVELAFRSSGTLVSLVQIGPVRYSSFAAAGLSRHSDPWSVIGDIEETDEMSSVSLLPRQFGTRLPPPE
ncbi:hypothetical protein SODALDRAFT_356692 [Sodiomyces alkalinus F11]|uniref:Uncharacterized protein n=1 Tax=Sodiomyces alkalinus (strain CBS 110278 / VKM F-3762 / F11) TaxID=1314773 RepID=A0A3N2Q1N8_SODAK|nr:hypothetical protein SODALDRAFT_356692 [Sodiomyces alkalinus F11]ROT40683.1 hypothetical protein SODALDRAFT_356692 [Sodiomyces alkalinus F11]